MVKMNISDYHKLEEYYTRKLLGIARSVNYSHVIWQDPIDNGVKVSK